MMRAAAALCAAAAPRAAGRTRAYTERGPCASFEMDTSSPRAPGCSVSFFFGGY